MADKVEPKAELVATAKGLLPRNLEELYRLASAFHKSGLVPQGLNSPEKILVAVQMGLEVGLSPMQAVQGIAVINGKPSLYGDAALGVVQSSGLLEDFKEEPLLDGEEVIGYRCTAKRKGQETPIVHEFTARDAKRAGLLDKRGPWQEYRPRMYQMRARSWTLRDGFADALKGLCIVEEVQDIKSVEARVVDDVSAREEELLTEIDAAGLPEPVEPEPEPEPAPPEPNALPEEPTVVWLREIEGILKKNWPGRGVKDQKAKCDMLERLFETRKWAEVEKMDAKTLEKGFSGLLDIMNSDEFV